MRNLKKILALVLVLVMSFSLVSVSSAAFTDQADVNEDYALAVELLNDMGVLTGYTDGSFRPEGTIKRAEMAAIIYRLTTGDVEGEGLKLFEEYAGFSDTKGHWASAYIGYCASKSYITGYPDGTFKPNAEVTGIEAMIMILRAVGYNKTNIFAGDSWKVTALSYGQEVGITETIKSYALVGEATREVVAEMAFNALKAYMVSWTPAGGYSQYQNIFTGNVPNKTLGDVTFDLVYHGAVAIDDWGRPGYKWTYNTGKEETIHEIDYSFKTTEMVDECDIAHEMGDKSYDITTAYIDGDKVAATAVATLGDIDKLDTVSIMGGQGRLTEIYLISGKAWVVEINTYLGQVTKVTPVYTDKNGHTTTASYEVTIYDGTAAANWVLTKTGADFALYDFVLVNVLTPSKYDADTTKNAASIKEIKAAPRTAAGRLLGWTNEVHTTAGTHVLTVGTYKDADKFELNWRNTTKAWDVLTDSYGNIIGLTESTTSYAVVEKIQWVHNVGFGGYAYADIVLSNGERVSGVTIAYVGTTAANNVNVANGVVATSKVADNLANNTDYYNHIFAYTVNADGTYNLTQVAPHDGTAKVMDLATASYTNTLATISNQLNTVVATDNTVFLYKNADGYTYTTYVGKGNAPSITNATMCVLLDDYGYARTVVVTSYTLASNTFVAYVTDATVDTYATIAGALYNGYYVYKLGETTPELVYVAAANDTMNTEFTARKSGLYEFVVGTGNIVSAVNYKMVEMGAGSTTLTTPYTLNNISFARLGVVAGVSGSSFQTGFYTLYNKGTTTAFDGTTNGYTVGGVTAARDFEVTADTKFIGVDKNANGTAVIYPTVAADVQANEIIFVAYSLIDNAQVVYVVNNYTAAVVATPGTVSAATMPVSFADVNAIFGDGVLSAPVAQLVADEQAQLNFSSVNGKITISSKTGTKLDKNDYLTNNFDNGTHDYFIVLRFTQPDNVEAAKATWVDGGANNTGAVSSEGVFDFLLCLTSADKAILNRQIKWLDANGTVLATTDVILDLTGVNFN